MSFWQMLKALLQQKYIIVSHYKLFIVNVFAGKTLLCIFKLSGKERNF